MGTNYYARVDVCDKCGRPAEEVHLGKSSIGWQFCFAFNEGRFYKTVPEMKKWLKDKQIWDEYDRPTTHKEFWNLIKVKQKINNPDDTFTMDIGGYRFMDGEFS